jgi:hypothetical protein
MIEASSGARSYDMHVIEQHNVSLFLEPVASGDLVAMYLTLEWMDEKATLEVWSRRLAIITNATTALSIEVFGAAEAIALQALSHKTPGKMNRDIITVDDTLFDEDDVVVVAPVYKQKIDDIDVYITQNPPVGDLSRIFHETEVILETVTMSLAKTGKNWNILKKK